MKSGRCLTIPNFTAIPLSVLIFGIWPKYYICFIPHMQEEMGTNPLFSKLHNKQGSGRPKAAGTLLFYRLVI